MLFDWDPEKAASNELKHGVSFDEAATVFRDRHAVHEPDPEHSIGEERFRATGLSRAGRLLVVAYTEDGDVTRLISARKATRREKRRHAEGR
ncbi:MAG TPA: BrnT family toxin [Longimicrobium sp.]